MDARPYNLFNWGSAIYKTKSFTFSIDDLDDALHE